jgi:hypothetical protein
MLLVGERRTVDAFATVGGGTTSKTLKLFWSTTCAAWGTVCDNALPTIAAPRIKFCVVGIVLLAISKQDEFETSRKRVRADRKRQDVDSQSNEVCILLRLPSGYIQYTNDERRQYCCSSCLSLPTRICGSQVGRGETRPGTVNAADSYW